MTQDTVRRLVDGLVRRARVARALDAAVRAALAAACLLATALAWHKFHPLDARVWQGLIVVAMGAVLAGAALGWARRVSRVAAAKRADDALALDDRLSSACEFLSTPEPTPFMLAHLSETAARVEGLRAAEAIPIRPPRGLRALAAAIIVLGFLLIVPGFASHAPAPTPMPPALPPLPAMRFSGERTVDGLLARIDASRDPKLRELLRELKRLYADAREGTLARDEALARIGALDAKLRDAEAAGASGRDARTWRRSVENALAGKGKELLKDPATTDLGRAMMTGDLDAASKESRSLEGRAAATPPTLKLTAEQSQALAEVLKHAAEQSESERELDVLSRDLSDASQALTLDDMKALAEAMAKAAKDFESLRDEMEKMEGLARADDELEEMKEALGAMEQDAEGRWVMRFGGKGGGAGGFFDLTGIAPPDKREPESGAGTAKVGPGAGGVPERTPGTLTPAEVSGRWGSGASLVEIVKGAASEGVATQAYRDAVESAARAAEDAVYAEDIPLGYRLYVKRYFQTIQPPARDNR